MVVTKEAAMGKKARKPTAPSAGEPVASEGPETPGAVEHPAQDGAGPAPAPRGSARCGVAGEPDSRARAGELEADVPGLRGRGLKTRTEPEERELTLARAKIGELMMRLELAEHLIEKRGLADEWKRSRR